MRIILIEKNSGYIFGDSADFAAGVQIDSPEQAARLLDESIGDTDSRETDATGYHCYRADVDGSEAVPVVHDGQCRDTIEAVINNCKYVGFVPRVEHVADLEHVGRVDIDSVESAYQADEKHRQIVQSNLSAPVRAYLNVPVADKETVRKLGACWDGGRHKWFISATNSELFNRWLSTAFEHAVVNDIGPQTALEHAVAAPNDVAKSAQTTDADGLSNSN